MNDIDQSKAPLLDHLIELRRRLLYCALAIVILPMAIRELERRAAAADPAP